MEQTVEAEEAVFVCNLRGIVDVDQIDAALATKNYEFQTAPDDQILLRIGGQIFLCEWEHVLGTDMILEPATSQCIGISEKRLVGERRALPLLREPLPNAVSE